MKTLKEICLEASILADIEDTLYVDITKDIFDKIFKSQSKDEFNTRVELLKTILNTKPEKLDRKDIICNIRATYDDSYCITLSRYNKVVIVTITYENKYVIKRVNKNKNVKMNLIPLHCLYKGDASGILPKEIIIKDLF